MNAELLLEHYERIADAPDAIERLRRFILDLAVRGKLVEQDTTDEPASKLLSAFQAERQIRIAKKEMRNSRPLSGIDDQPFEIPKGWLWLPLGETGNIFSGNSINESTRERLCRAQSGRPFIATKDVGYGLDQLAYENGLLVPTVDTTFKIARPNTPLICSEGGSAGRKIGLCDREICFGNKLIANEPWSSISPKYVLYVYLSPFFYEEFRASMTGVIGGISLNRFVELPFPLPPFEEQHRIVAKVDELMALCDQLETARADREMGRDKLTLSTLAKLNEPDPETLADDARFALEHFEPLAKRTDQIKQLRQTILNLAVRGKLVEQDPNDEPASELLKRIDNAKQKIRGSGKRELEADGAPSEVVPFGIPLSWVWCGATYPAQSISDAGHKIQTKDVLASGKHPVVDQGKVFIRGYCNDDDKLVRVRKPVIVFGDHTRETKLIDFDFIVGADGVKILEPIEISAQFYHLCLKWLPLDSRGYGRHFKLLRQSHIPLPPLAEQHRIVAKVDELMALCDQLEASLIEGEQTRSKLLEAVLCKTLETS